MRYLIAALLLFNMYFGQLFPDVVGWGTFAAGAYLSALLLIPLVARRSRRILSEAVSRVWLLFAVLVAVTIAYSSNSLVAASFVLLTVLVLVLLSAVSDAWVVPFLRVLVLYGMVHVVATIVFYLIPPLYSMTLGDRFNTGPSPVGYVSGLAANYTHNAMYCALAFLVLASWAMSEKRLSRRNVALVLAVVALFAVFLTTKRAHLAFAVLAIVVVFTSSQVRGRYFKVAVALFTGYLVLRIAAGFVPGIASSLERIEGTFATDDVQQLTSGRTLLWDYAIDGWRDKPVFGHGWASYHFVWPGGRLESIHSHNAILNAMYETGIVGTLVMLSATLVSLYLAFRSVSKLGPEASVRELSITRSSFAIQIFMLSHAYTSEELFRNPYSYTGYLLAIAVLISVRVNRGLGCRLHSSASTTSVESRTSSRDGLSA
ncbi:O-antigen ligase family protein [Brevibacterium luteolum]|nr:O-antigen ligase family protein [Brevibacterium luteolum]